MDDDPKYRIFQAQDNLQDLDDVLTVIATTPDIVRIVGITWQPSRTSDDGKRLSAGYTIIVEMDV